MRQIINPVGRHTDVIQPFAADLFTGAVAHSLFHIVAVLIGVQRIQPYKHHVLILGLELRLAVDSPGKIPVVGTVLNGDDASGRYLARTRIALADIHNVPNYLFV